MYKILRIFVPLFFLTTAYAVPTAVSHRSAAPTPLKTAGSNSDVVVILSVDGGGYRGVVTTKILSDIERLLGGTQMYQFVDIFAGTSVGSIVASSLNTPIKNRKPFTAKETFDYFKKIGKDVFKISKKRIFSSLGLMRKSKFDPIPLEKNLYNVFHTMPLGAAIRPMVLTGFAIEYSKDYNFFSTIKSQRDIKIADAIRASAAAPIFFPPKSIIAPYPTLKDNPKKVLFADGGLASNAPHLIAVQYAQRLFPGKKIFVLSIATGKPAGKQYDLIKNEQTAGGILKGLKPLLKGSLNAQIPRSINDVLHISEVVEFYRINVDLPSNCIKMDKPENHDCLMKAAESSKNIMRKRVRTNKHGHKIYEMQPTTFSAVIQALARVKGLKITPGPAS